MDCSTPGLPVHHQLPEFTQTHVHRVGDAIQPSHPLSSPSPPVFNLSHHQKKRKKVKSFSCVWLFVTPWTVAYQAPLSMEFSRQEYWSGLPFPSPGDLPNPGIEPGSPALQADTLPSEPPGNQFFESGGQSIGVSASTSVLPMNIQDWSPLDSLVASPCCPRGSQESFPTPQFKSINSLVLRFLYSPTLTSIHDHWKNHILD